jgi:hypothetical protein
LQYVGKDIVTHGALLHLDKNIAWKDLRSRAKQGIRKAQNAGIKVTESRDLALMAKLWYDPETLTTKLEPEQRLFLAYVKEELVGGIIITPVTPNTLFYHYGGTNELGRTIEANAYLFWHVVEEYHSSDWEYLDVGVSFRQELQHYFQKYCTQPYPILFHAPPDPAKPRIRLEPFSGDNLDEPEELVIAINTRLCEYFETEFTFIPSWHYALQSALRASVGKGKRVGVWSSIAEASYVDELNALFGDQWTFVARDKNADARVVAHRWGYLCKAAEELAADPRPLIEDCRDVMIADSAANKPGTFGKFSLFDFSRWLPLPFGAALVGQYFEDRHIWNNFHCLDIAKRNRVREGLQIHWPRLHEYQARREHNQRRLKNLFGLTGMHRQVEEQAAPCCYVFKSEEPYSVKSIHERLAKFGITTELDTKEKLIAIPCHPKLGDGQLEYIFAAVRGMINPCHTYVRQDPEKKA